MDFTAYRSDSWSVLGLRDHWRATTLTPLRGDLLDVGSGNGNGLGYFSPAAQLTCLEPHAGHVRTLERRTATRAGTRILHGQAERIPLDDACIDTAVCGTVLCSVDDPDRALREIHRVLRPGGHLVLLEHVGVPAGSWTRAAQRLIAPLSRWLDHGCDPTRDTEAVLTRSPFTTLELARVDTRGPLGTTTPHLVGFARRAAEPAVADSGTATARP